MKVKKLNDGRWRIINDDGIGMSCTIDEWVEAIDFIIDAEEMMEKLGAYIGEQAT